MILFLKCESRCVARTTSPTRQICAASLKPVALRTTDAWPACAAQLVSRLAANLLYC